MEPLLENLTLAPAAQLFELDPPHYTSSYGRRTEAVFKNNVPPAPMLISPDNGLILYERVISTKAEHQLLDKLTKPKYYHPTPTIRKGGKGGSHGTAPSSSSSSPGAAARSKSATRRPSSGNGTHQHFSAHSSVGLSSAAAEVDSRTAAGSFTATLSGHGTSQHHHVRSFSAGRGLPSAVAHVKRKPLYPEEGPLKDYFSKERASVTATTVFTWGNRYKIGDCGTGRGVTGGGITVGIGGRVAGDSDRAAFSSYTPVQQKPPLRL